MKASEVQVGATVETKIGDSWAPVIVGAESHAGPASNRRRWWVKRVGGGPLPKPRTAAAMRKVST